MYRVDKKIIAANLRKLRGNRKIDVVAKALDITPSALTNYENAIRIPRDEVKAKIANYYGVTIESIFFNSNYNIS